MKVYLVCSGEYSDFRVDSVFLNRRVAYRYKLVCEADENSFGPWSVQEHDTMGPSEDKDVWGTLKKPVE